MPVKPKASQLQQHHVPILSALRHVFQASSHLNPSAVAPDPPTPSPHPLSSSSSPLSSSSLSSSSSHDPHRLQLYETFESNLVQRLSSLFPSEDSSCVNMAFLKQILQVLLETQADLAPLTPSDLYPLSQAQTRMMEEFLDHQSIQILDVCRAIKEQILNVETSQSTLQLILSCLAPKYGGMLHAGQVARARTALATMLLPMEGDEEVAASVQLYRSFRFRCNVTGPDVPQRWGSWHGSGCASGTSNTHALQSSRQLHVIGSVLTLRKLAAGDVEESFCAAIHALNVMSILFLGSLAASLPSLNKTYVTSLPTQPRSFPWASPLSCLHEKVQHELKVRGKKSNCYAGMWELDQIATILKRLFDLVGDEDYTLGAKSREEIKNLSKQLRQHVEEVDRDLGSLYTELKDFYEGIISMRMEILDILCKLKS